MKDNRVEVTGQIDINVPNAARTYDYLLGGAHNFAADRQLAEAGERAVPHLRDSVRLNRTFLRRAVRFMISSGIRQFLDIGSGIPTVGNVHEIAQEVDPKCRVVYVDKEPMAVVHSRLLLEGNDNAIAIQADIREPEDIFGRPEPRELLNYAEPMGLLMLLVWHFVPDSDDPVGVMARYRDMLAPGSFLGLSHIRNDEESAPLQTMVDEVRQSIESGLTLRPYEQVLPMFDGFELVEPGLVGCASWHPDGPGDYSDRVDANRFILAGVGRKPGAPEPAR